MGERPGRLHRLRRAVPHRHRQRRLPGPARGRRRQRGEPDLRLLLRADHRRRHRLHVQPVDRRQADHRPAAVPGQHRGHLHREDHLVGRPEDQGLLPQDAAAHPGHPGDPLRRLRRHRAVLPLDGAHPPGAVGPVLPERQPGRLRRLHRVLPALRPHDRAERLGPGGPLHRAARRHRGDRLRRVRLRPHQRLAGGQGAQPGRVLHAAHRLQRGGRADRRQDPRRRRQHPRPTRTSCSRTWTASTATRTSARTRSPATAT